MQKFPRIRIHRSSYYNIASSNYFTRINEMNTATAIELRARSKRRRANIQRYILDVTAATGILAVSLVSPRVGKLLEPMMHDLAHPNRTNAKIRRSFQQLLKNGMIEMKEKNGKKFVQITNKGRMKMLRLYVDSHNRNKPKWDKRWRLVIYDIKEKRRKTRQNISHILKNFGFKKLQGSVWAYPFPCEELITLLKAELKIGKDLLYMIVEELEQDATLRAHFELE